MLIPQYENRPEHEFAPRPRCGSCEYYAGHFGDDDGQCHGSPPVLLTRPAGVDTGSDVVSFRPQVRADDVHCQLFEYRVVAGGLADLAAKPDVFAGLI